MSHLLDLAAALLVLAGPGLAINAALGLRGWTMVGAAPGTTLGFAGFAVTATTSTGIPWTWGTVSGLLALVVAVAAVVTKPWRAERAVQSATPTWSRIHHLATAMAVAVAGAVGGMVIYRASGSLTNVPQGWDAIFHAGAVRQIVDTQSADPAALSAIAQPENANFYYPDVYHALAALLDSAAGAGAVVTLNTFSTVVPVLFAASLSLLVMVITRKPSVTVLATLLSSVVTYFPFNTVRFGPLLPFGLAIAAAPTAIALLLLLIRHRRIACGIALAAGLSGTFLTHPSVALAIVLWGVLQAVPALVREGNAVVRPLLLLVGTAGLSLLLVAPVLSPLTSTAGESSKLDGHPFTTPAEATRLLVTFTFQTVGPQSWLALGLVAGVLSATVRTHLLPTVGFAAIMGSLFVFAGGVGSTTALMFTSFWWDDPARFAALFALPALVLVASGLVGLRDGLLTLAARVMPVARRPWLRPALMAVAVLAFTLRTNGYAVLNEAQVAVAFTSGPTLSVAEQDGLTVLAEDVRSGGGGTVLNDSYDGSAWAYPIHGLHMVFPTPITPPASLSVYGDDRLLLLDHLNQVDYSPAVRQAAARLGVRWVVVDSGYVAPFLTRARGLTGLNDVRSLVLVYDNPEIQIYRLKSN